MNTRLVSTYPHSGRQFLCSDTITWEDHASMLAAFQHVKHRGHIVASATIRESNLGGVLQIGNQVSRKIPTPPLGCVDSFTFYPNLTWSNHWAFELHPALNSFMLRITVRLLDQAEYNTINNLQSGDGWRGQFLRLQVWNQSAAAIQGLVTFYLDPIWYAANVGPLDTNWVDFTTGGGSGSAKSFIVFAAADPTLICPTRAQPATLFAELKWPRKVDGTPWGATNTEAMNGLGVVNHPDIAYAVAPAGLIDFSLSAYHDVAISTVFTAGVGTFGRVVSAYSTADIPDVGMVFTPSEWARAGADYLAARSVGMVAFAQGSPCMGGVRMPLIGDRGTIVNESGVQTFTRFIEIPANAKRATVVGYVRTFAAGGMTQAVSVVLEKPLAVGITNQVLFTDSSATSTATRIVYADIALGAGIQPQTAYIERAYLIISSVKTNPRAGTVANTPTYWDGWLSLMVKFY